MLKGQYFFGGALLAGAPFLTRTYDASPDGKRFLMIKDAALPPAVVPASIVVVQNWLEELKRLVPTK